MIENQHKSNAGKKELFLQHKEKLKNTKEAFTDELKSIGRKIGFVTVFSYY